MNNSMLKIVPQQKLNEEQTPIEIMLGVDINGEITATKLYEFLQLNKSNFAKWCKKNIVENEFVEENIDFTRLVF